MQRRTQTEDTTGVQRSERSFALGISSKHPITPEPVTPPISSDLVGTFAADGKLELAFDTDLFPSHGFTVTRNGTLQLTDVVTDVSCLPKHKVVGLTGIETVSAGLIQKVQEGSVTVNPDDAGRQLVAKSKLCELSVDVHQVPGTPSSRGSARTSARSVSVALLDRNGRPGRFVTLPIAARFGIVQAVPHGNGLLVLSDPARPIALRLTGRRLLVEMRRVRGGQVHSQAAFGPVSGTLETRMGTRLAARRNGRRLRGRRPDRKAPRTRAVVRVRGGVAKVRFRARDRSGVSRTRVVVGRRLVRLRRGVLRVPARRISRVRFASVDVLGNAERWRKIRPRRR